MSKDPVQLDYQHARSRPQTSAAAQIVTVGVLVSAPIGFVLGLKAAWGRNRIQLGYVGAMLNFLPAIYAITLIGIVLSAVIFS